ncbi:MAG: TonB-dependent receptor [Cytophagales bacterium]|nr:TonB-dependent receptor [Cytophagales bacterium]
MTKNFTKILLTTGCLLLAWIASAQTTISGKVTEAGTGEGLIGVNILVKGTVLGTITDFDGNFNLTVSSSPPITIVISSVGFGRQEIEIADANTTGLSVEMDEIVLLGQEVVVSASRVEESVMKSPVSIERMNILDIQNTPATDFYSALKNLNGVDFSTQSITFRSVNARGFNANGNTRFVQLIDGIDNQAPGLNFPVGNVVGIGELDLESVELIPGAASALYGPNAIQGILLMNSKSPFDYQGLDFYTKLGVTHMDGEDADPALYKDMGIRYAKAYNNKIAFKLTGSWLNAQDFIAVDYRDQSGIVERSADIDPLDRSGSRNYDGVNTYGDFGIDIGTIADIVIADGAASEATAEQIATAASVSGIRSLLPNGANGYFTPTGYRETDFVDNTTESIKVGAALHYRLNDKLEILGQFNQGWGSTVYTANDRFILDNFTISTAKLELRGSDFFLRAYKTQEDAGDTYAANTLASRINQQFYLTPYFGTYAGLIGAGTASNEYDNLHAASRTVADAAQPSADSQEFKEAADVIKATSIADGGAKFLDKSSLYHYEGSYNLRNVVDWADIVVGANVRKFALNSDGTLFALRNNGKEVNFYEYGGYIQIKRAISETIDVQFSGRYDKNKNFDGQFTPRVSTVWEFMEGHNLRGSYQTGFRIPTTQDQYIDLDVVTRRLIGRNQILRDRYNIDENPVYSTPSVLAAQAAGLAGDLNARDLLEIEEQVYDEYVTEKVGTWEIGYKGLLMDGRLFVDAFYYQSTYRDLLAEVDVTQAVQAGGTVDDLQTIPAGYDVGTAGHSDAQKDVFVAGGATGIFLHNLGYDVNIDQEVKSTGFGLGAEYSLGGGYNLGANLSQNKILDLDDIVAQEFNVAFNTPEWRYNIKFGNRKLTDRLGFNLTYRWQDAYVWQSSIGSGVIPQYGTMDAQVSYDLPSLKARVKLGGSNITNQRYTTSFANPRQGAIYYLQLNLNNILN